MNYTRNSDLNFYKEKPWETNCGSYALRLNEWYELDPYFEDVTGYYIDEWIDEQGEKGFSDFEISEMYGEILVEGILQDFEGELEVCNGRPPATKGVELIAFATFCYYVEDGSPDFDYHFKVLRDGKWMEKCGTDRVRECEEDEWGDYISGVTYFYHRIGEVA